MSPFPSLPNLVIPSRALRWRTPGQTRDRVRWRLGNGGYRFTDADDQRARIDPRRIGPAAITEAKPSTSTSDLGPSRSGSPSGHGNPQAEPRAEQPQTTLAQRIEAAQLASQGIRAARADAEREPWFSEDLRVLHPGTFPVLAGLESREYEWYALIAREITVDEPEAPFGLVKGELALAFVYALLSAVPKRGNQRYTGLASVVACESVTGEQKIVHLRFSINFRNAYASFLASAPTRRISTPASRAAKMMELLGNLVYETSDALSTRVFANENREPVRPIGVREEQVIDLGSLATQAQSREDLMEDLEVLRLREELQGVRELLETQPDRVISDLASHSSTWNAMLSSMRPTLAVRSPSELAFRLVRLGLLTEGDFARRNRGRLHQKLNDAIEATLDPAHFTEKDIEPLYGLYLGPEASRRAQEGH